MTTGGAVMSRARAMNGVLVPLPAPGAPPSQMNSLGNRRSLAVLLEEVGPHRREDELRILDLQVGSRDRRRLGVGRVRSWELQGRLTSRCIACLDGRGRVVRPLDRIQCIILPQAEPTTHAGRWEVRGSSDRNRGSVGQDAMSTEGGTESRATLLRRPLQTRTG